MFCLAVAGLIFHRDEASKPRDWEKGLPRGSRGRTGFGFKDTQKLGFRIASVGELRGTGMGFKDRVAPGREETRVGFKDRVAARGFNDRVAARPCGGGRPGWRGRLEAPGWPEAPRELGGLGEPGRPRVLDIFARSM